MNINPGELNRRISIITASIVQDNEGFDAEKEIEVCKCWAKVNNMSGTEMYKAGANYNKTVTRFLVRYRRDIKFTAKMKIRFGKKIVDGEEKDIYFNIIYANNYNYSNEFVELVAEVVE